MTVVMQQIIQQTAQLSGDEQLALATILIEQARRQTRGVSHSWLAVAGTAPHPLTGEDAQAWVTRTRAEERDTERKV